MIGFKLHKLIMCSYINNPIILKDNGNKEELLLKTNSLNSFSNENIVYLQEIENVCNNNDWPIWTHSEHFFENNLLDNTNQVNNYLNFYVY